MPPPLTSYTNLPSSLSISFPTVLRRCVAASSSNTTRDGYSLHLFPSDPKYRQIWTQKVLLTRAKWMGPSKHSHLCSAHCEETCFEPGMFASFGLKRLHRLRPDAIPTIFRTSRKAARVSPKKRREAFSKRERIGVSFESCLRVTSGPDAMQLHAIFAT